MSKTVSAEKETPLMKQYNAIKAKYPEALLLFRVGDFYETFGEDAIKASKILGIVLTRRANGSASFIELAGFPYHSLETYLPKLVRAGQRVAICDQLEDPKMTKTIVKRGVTELVTPGVSVNDKVLDHKSNNFLAAVHFSDTICGVAFADISTGEFLAAEGNAEYIDKLLQSFRPSEVIFQKNKLSEFQKRHGDKFYTFTLDEWIFSEEFARDKLLNHFGTKSLKGFGVDEMKAAVVAAGVALHYFGETQQDNLRHIAALSRIEEEKYMWLDRFTVRNLELVYSQHGEEATLIGVLDQTKSPMGARLMKRWMMLPLKEARPITERHEVVDYFMSHPEIAARIAQHLKQLGDLERLISKISLRKIFPREVVQLRRALLALEPVKEACLNSGSDQLKKIGEQINLCLLSRERIGRELVPDPPMLISKGRVIADGVNEELDTLRAIAYSGKDYLLQLQQNEAERTRIPSLKVSFNNVFGYYIEVTNVHKDKVPAEWIRKQTLTNAERYITAELKEYEEKILGAEEKILTLETQLFNDLVLSLSDDVLPVQLNAALAGRLDCLVSFAETAIANHFVRPQMNDSKVLDIRNGRHPVIEKYLPPGEEYVANDVYLDDETQQIMIITGPNMSGKSALLRQTALIVLMAQMGSYVPADSAQIGIVDKIFTRVGASDNLSSGESTFMVEMTETASILNNLSDRSLILLDEIGRGTSTYDGISIAWSIAEYLHNQPQARAKTLFATHYHELNDMADTMSRIKNYNVSVKELDKKVIFLRKLVPGGSAHSFGIHVARMAGIPHAVVMRANEILLQLEKVHGSAEISGQSGTKKTGKQKDDFQLSFFKLDDPLLEQIRQDILNLDINALTPVEALMKLNEIKKLLGK